MWANYGKVKKDFDSIFVHRHSSDLVLHTHELDFLKTY